MINDQCDDMFANIDMIKVIDNCVVSKTVTLLAMIDGQHAVVKIAKRYFDGDVEAVRSIQGCLRSCWKSHQNDIYYKYQVDAADVAPGGLGQGEKEPEEQGNKKVEERQGRLHPSINGLSCEVIYPATEKIILKNTSMPMHILEEDKETYQKITLPWMEKNPASDLKWLTAILEGKAELENIILKRPEWILTKDYKQDTIGQKEGFHYLALFYDRSLRSIRDLNEKHLPLLKEVLALGRETISKELGIKPSEVRVYFHYLPTFFLLHVHFNHVKEVSAGEVADRAHMLATVISNIEIRSDYYQLATLNLRLRETDVLKYQS